MAADRLLRRWAQGNGGVVPGAPILVAPDQIGRVSRLLRGDVWEASEGRVVGVATMRILITGANGQLGKALQRVLGREDLVLKELPAFDLTNPASVEQIRRADPQIILHVGAYTNVDKAEQEPERARAVNAEGTRRVAEGANAVNARLVYVSTDYVFDGTKQSPYHEQDTPNPLNQYGRSKYEGEQAVLTLCQNALVVRTAWLFGHDGHNFVKTIVRLAQERPVLEVVADQRRGPTSAQDLPPAPPP